MKGHARIMVFMLLVGLLVMTGCEKKYTGSETTDTKDKIDTETESMTESATESETEAETNPAAVKESVEAEKVTESSIQNKKDFVSNFGYHVIYDESLFEYNRTGDYDEIALKGQTFSSKPPVFFAAMKIKNDQLESIVAEIFNESAKDTVIGDAGYTALCQPTAESIDDGKGLLHHNQYLVKLDNGDALLFETQWYEESGGNTSAENTSAENTYGKVLTQMLDSIVIEGCTPQETESGSETDIEMESQTETESNTESDIDTEQ